MLIEIEFLTVRMRVLQFHEIQKMDVLNIIIRIVGYFQVVEMVKKKYEKLV
jgi:hypothetical protein